MALIKVLTFFCFVFSIVKRGHGKNLKGSNGIYTCTQWPETGKLSYNDNDDGETRKCY